MNSLELTSTITALANAIACKLTNDDISILANILDQLSDTLSTIATYRSICKNQNESTGRIKNPTLE